MDDTKDVILGILVNLYLIASQIFAFIFFIHYCKIDPILKIILVDSWYSEIKGLLLPFFIHQLF